MNIAMSLVTFCLVAMLLIGVTLAGHIHGDIGHDYHHGGYVGRRDYDRGGYDNDGNDAHDIKAYKGSSDTGYALKNNNADDFGFDQYSQGSNKDAAAKKHLKAASADKNHNKRLKKQSENKRANKNVHNKAEASASARKKERNAQASKKHAKKYNRAKNINIYSKKASDITNSFEDSSVTAKSSSKDSEAKKAAAKDKGMNAQSRSDENKLSLQDQGSSNAASKEQSNAARVKTAGLKNGKSGRKLSSSNGNRAYLKRTGPSSFKKSSVHIAAGRYGLGNHLGVTGIGGLQLYGGYPTGGGYLLGSKGGSSLGSNIFGIGEGYGVGFGLSSGSLRRRSIYSLGSRPYRVGAVISGSLSSIYGTGGQQLGSNTFGIGDSFLGGYRKSGDTVGTGSLSTVGTRLSGLGTELPASSLSSVRSPGSSLSNVRTGLPDRSVSNVRIGLSGVRPGLSGVGGGLSSGSASTVGIGRPSTRIQKSTVYSVGDTGSPKKLGGRSGYGQQGVLDGYSDPSGFGSLGSNLLDDFDDDDDDDLFDFGFGSSGFGGAL